MCNDQRRISDIRNLNHKPGRRLLFVAVCLIMSLCFCVPGFASGQEWLEYEDVFDSSNSVAILRYSRSVTYYGEGANFPETVPFDDVYIPDFGGGSVTFFDSAEISSIVQYAQNNSCTWVDLNCSVTLLHRKLDNENAVFPVPDATTFNCRSFHCSVNVVRGSVVGGLTSGQSFTFKYRVPGQSNWVSDTATVADNMVLISRYISNVREGVYYTNSLAISELSTVFEFSGSETDNFNQLVSPELNFSFSNVYQYSLGSVETTQTPESTQTPETTGFVPGVDTVIPSDTMHGIPDDIDNVLDDRYQDFVNNYTDILNGFSWVKYANCFGLIGQFFGKVFQFEPFSDILNAWAIFAVFNILLGGFITGVSAYVRTKTRDNEKKEREAEVERELMAKRNIERQRSSRWWSDD